MGKLKSALRTVALTTKLPSNGGWYEPNVINYNLNNEVEIYPMTHGDEILMHNPDSLFTNNAVSKIITSCCPNINDVNKILMPDIEALLLAIKIASVNDELEVYNICPKCFENKNTLPEEEVNKLIEEKKLSVEPQTFIFDARSCLEHMEIMPDKFSVSIPNKNITVNIKPLTLAENTEYEINDFYIKNLIQRYILENKDVDNNTELFTNVTQWEENRKKNEDFNKLLIQLDEIVIKMIKSSIKSIIYEGEELTDEEDINELLTLIDTKTFEKIKKTTDEANKSRLKKAFNCQCKYCGHEWVNDNINFNFSNFFGKGS